MILIRDNRSWHTDKVTMSGKKGLIVKRLSRHQRDAIAIANPAGMVLIWDKKRKI